MPRCLPALPDDQHPILAAYLKHDADLFKIAQAVDRPIHDVLQALSTSPLREYIAHATAHTDEADRRLAAATLRDTIRTTDSPVEKRRAASALGRIVQITRAAARATDHAALRAATACYRSYRGAVGAMRSGQTATDGQPRRRDRDESASDPEPQRGDPHRESGTDDANTREPEIAPPEPLRGHGHLTPGESVAAFLINLRNVWYSTDAIPDVFTRVRDNTSMFVRMYAIDQEQFRQDLAAALPLLERGPWRTEPALIEGDAAAVRTIFARDDGREAACIFRLVKAQKHYPPAHWFVDGLSPDDSS